MMWAIWRIDDTVDGGKGGLMPLGQIEASGILEAMAEARERWPTERRALLDWPSLSPADRENFLAGRWDRYEEPPRSKERVATPLDSPQRQPAQLSLIPPKPAGM